MVRIALAEDNYFLARSLVEKLELFEEFKVKFHAQNGLELLDWVKADNQVDVVLMDIQMPELDGINTTAQLLSAYPHIKVIMLTIMDTEQLVQNAIQAGAVGYLLKESTPQQIFEAIYSTLNGGASMSPGIALKALRLIKNPQASPTGKEDFNLSAREQSVLEQLSSGQGYKQTASNLFISPNTVRKHINSIYKKLGVNNKVAAIQKARQHQLI